LVLRTPIREIELISNYAMHRVSEIKLIRTDTTLDLSQKAEKVCLSIKQSRTGRDNEKIPYQEAIAGENLEHAPMPLPAGERGVGGPKPAA